MEKVQVKTLYDWITVLRCPIVNLIGYLFNVFHRNVVSERKVIKRKKVATWTAEILLLCVYSIGLVKRSLGWERK